MSWWDSAGFTNLAQQALKTAQKRIDKVLDIEDEGKSGAAPVATSSSVSASSSSSKRSGNTVDEFWNDWLPGDDDTMGPGSTPFLSETKQQSQTKVTSSLTLSTTTSVKESTKHGVSMVKDSTVSNEVISVTKPKFSQSDHFESVGLTTAMANETVGLAAAMDTDSSDSFTNKQSSFSRNEKVSETVRASAERKRSPLKLGNRSKSKEKAAAAVPQESVGIDDGSSKLAEEILKREKEAEEKMLQLLNDTSERDLKGTKIQDTCSDTVSTDKINQKGEHVPQKVVQTAEDDQQTINTGTVNVLSAGVTDDQCMEPKATTESVPHSTGQDLNDKASDDMPRDQPTDTTGVLDKLNVMVDSEIMESSICNWDDAGLLTDSQIVTDDIKSEETETMILNDVKECNTFNCIEENIESAEQEVVLVQDTTDDAQGEVMSTDQDIMEGLEAPTSFMCESTEDNIPEQKPDIVCEEDNQVESKEIADLADGISLVSTLDESLTSETVDDLSSSNQTLTAEDLQSVATSRTSENDLDMSDSKENVEDRQSDVVQTEEETIEAAGSAESQDMIREDKCDISDLPLVHQGPGEEAMEGAEKGQQVHHTSSSPSIPTAHSSQSESPATTTTVQSMTASHSSQCSSSSLVKNMLEEAMTESVKDIDSRSDSHSSSDMVRIGSSQNSGHTSADELETATSSDIEIISHISTPTPNGENRGFSVDRPFDLSPLRHALNKAVRRNSPPGHHRTDSGSSAYSLQSRNGDEVTSPGDHSHRYTELEQYHHHHNRGAERKTEEASNNDPLEKEKLLKENPTPTSLPIIAEGSELSQDMLHQDQNLDTHKLLEKLADMAEILEARERKLVDLSRSNMDLMESNTILKNQLQQSEETREAEMTDLNQLTEEFTKRISDTEKRFSQTAKERDSLKKTLQDTELVLAQRSDSTSTIEKMLKEKDMQISELLEEGEKLSKQQLQSNNLMKKLRSKEKESEKLIKSQEKKIETQSLDVERLTKVLDNKCDVEKKHTESINQLQSLVKNQEKELEKYKSENEESQEKLRSMQAALDNSYKEIAELHKATVRRASEVQERALSAEYQSKQLLQKELDRYKIQVRQEQEALVNQIEDLQLSMSRMEKEQGRREDVLRQEISDLHQRLQEGEDRNQDLTDSVTAATRPLLRQIENLQSTYTAQSMSYEKVEKNLTDRLTEGQHQLATAQEKERVATEQLLDINAKVATYESQLSSLRQDRSRLQAQLEMEKTKVEVLEDAKSRESAQREALQHSLESRLSELKKEKLLLENQLEMEKLKVESEKKKLLLAHEQLRDKELLLSQVKSRPVTPSDPLKDSVDNTMLGSLASMTTSSMSASFLSQPDEMERSFVMSPKASSVSLYESMRGSGVASLMENLQSQLKQKDGEIVQLQNEIHELENTREAMARELVNLTNEKHDLEDKASDLPETLIKYKELDQRYNAILQMYGEKEEEVQELRLDLQDMKDLYKTQIEELLQKS